MDLRFHQRSVNYLEKELQYIGNTIFIEDRRVCVKPLTNMLEATQR